MGSAVEKPAEGLEAILRAKESASKVIKGGKKVMVKEEDDLLGLGGV